jgi:2'-5' RNA ligase
VRSIELTFDPAVEASFRAEWSALEGAGLPHQGRPPHTSNRPHLTLAAGAALEPTDAVRAVFSPRDSSAPAAQPSDGVPSDGVPSDGRSSAGLSAAVAPPDVLPVELRMSGLLLFPAGPGRFVLARPVVVTAALLALHRALHERAPGAIDLTLPGRWTPHVTLARRLNAAQVAEALSVLGEPPPTGHCVAARFWNGETKTLTALSPEGEPVT